MRWGTVDCARKLGKAGAGSESPAPRNPPETEGGSLLPTDSWPGTRATLPVIRTEFCMLMGYLEALRQATGFPSRTFLPAEGI